MALLLQARTIRRQSTRASRPRWRTAPPSAGFALVLAACSGMYPYPDARPEHDPALCSDGEDNDFDARIDCEDIDCSAFCPQAIPEPDAEGCSEAGGVEIALGFQARSMRWPGPGWQRHASGDPEQILVRRRAFSGSWDDFQLSFSGSVPSQSLFRVAVVPAALAGADEAPVAGAETALLSVTLDTTQSPHLFAIDMDGAHFATEIPAALPACTDAGAEACARLDAEVGLSRDVEGILAKLTLPSGEGIELRAPAPSCSTLSPSRLVIWQGPIAADRAAEIHELWLSVKPGRVCGSASG